MGKLDSNPLSCPWVGWFSMRLLRHSRYGIPVIGGGEIMTWVFKDKHSRIIQVEP